MTDIDKPARLEAYDIVTNFAAALETNLKAATAAVETVRQLTVDHGCVEAYPVLARLWEAQTALWCVLDDDGNGDGGLLVQALQRKFAERACQCPACLEYDRTHGGADEAA